MEESSSPASGWGSPPGCRPHGRRPDRGHPGNHVDVAPQRHPRSPGNIWGHVASARPRPGTSEGPETPEQVQQRKVASLVHTVVEVEAGLRGCPSPQTCDVRLEQAPIPTPCTYSIPAWRSVIEHAVHHIAFGIGPHPCIGRPLRAVAEERKAAVLRRGSPGHRCRRSRQRAMAMSVPLSTPVTAGRSRPHAPGSLHRRFQRDDTWYGTGGAGHHGPDITMGCKAAARIAGLAVKVSSGW